jgi:hypothetical protein
MAMLTDGKLKAELSTAVRSFGVILFSDPCGLKCPREKDG